jgi:L-malate glycosyltransferase
MQSSSLGKSRLTDGAEPLHLLHVFSSFEIGGQQVRFCNVANAIGPGYRHTIIAMDQNYECGSRLSGNVRWQALDVPVTKSHGLSVGNLVRFRRLLGTLNPDLLVTYAWGALEWALVNRWCPLAPHVHFEDGFGPDESPPTQLRRRIYLRRIALGRKDMRVVVPSHTLWKIASESWGLTSQLLLMPNGVDCARFTPPTDPKRSRVLGIEVHDLVIGTVSALRPEKNLARLITAFAALGGELEATLVLAGDGPEREALEKLAARLGVRHRTLFVGPVKQPEDLYRRFDIFAMSSDTEQMPITLLEAMASGLPVVATEVGDIPLVVAAENRFLIEGCRDARALTEKLSILLANPELRAGLGMRNRARACSEFELSKMVESHRALLTSMARPPTQRAA